MTEIEAVLRLRDNLSPALAVAAKNLGQAGDKMQAVGQQFQAAGSAMLPISLAVSAAGIAALKFSTDFEASMLKVSTIAAESAGDVGHMSEAVLEMAPAVGIGPKALADALLVVESTGIKGAQALDILEMSAKASSAGLGETKDIARAVTAAITAYGAENLTAAQATDILFVAVKDGGAEAEEFAGSLGRVIGIAANLGVTFEETTGFVATFTRLGVDADEATTALRQTLMNFLHPAKQVRDALHEVGLSADDVRQSIRERGLAATLTDLVGRFEGNDEALGRVIPNVRALAGVLGTAGSQATAMRTIMEHLTSASGEMGEAFGRSAETGAFKWAKFKAEIERVGIAFGDKLAPAVFGAMDAMTPMFDMAVKLADAFGKLPDGIQTTAVAIGGLVAVLSPVLLGIGTLIKVAGFAADGLAPIAKVLSNIFKAMEPGAAIVDVLNGALRFFLSTAGAIVVATAALFTVTGTWGEFFRILKAGAEIIINLVVRAFNIAVTVTKELIEGIGGLLSVGAEFANFFLEILGVADGWRDFVRDFKNGMLIIAGVFEYVAVLTGDWAKELPKVEAPLKQVGLAAVSVAEGERLLAEHAERTNKKLADQTAASKPLNDALDGLRDSQEKLTVAARAYALFAGSDFMSKPRKVQEDYYNALQDVIDQYGSLAAAGMAYAQKDYETLSRHVGASKQVEGDFNKWLAQGKKDVAEEQLRIADDKAKRLLAGLKASNAAEIELLKLTQQASMTKYEFERAEIDHWLAAQKKGYDDATTMAQKYFDEQIALLRKHKVDWNEFLANDPTGGSQMIDPKAGVKPFDWFKDLDVQGAADSFEQLVNISGASVSKIAQNLGKLTKAIGMAGDAGQHLGAALEFNEFGELSGVKWGAMAVGAVELVGAMDAATSSSSRFKNAIGGAIAGAKAGAAMGAAFGASWGPWGLAIGAGAGALVGLVRGVDDADKKFNEFLTTFGGAETLKAKLMALGAEGERLWTTLSVSVEKYRESEKALTWEEYRTQQAMRDTAKVVQEAEERFKRYGLSLDDLISPQAALATSIRQVIADFNALKAAGFSDDRLGEAMSASLLNIINLAMELHEVLPNELGPAIVAMVGAWQRAFDAGGSSADAVSDKLNGMIRTAMNSGSKIPAVFAPLIEQLVNGGFLADDLANRLLGIPEKMKVPWQAMQEAAEEFGINLAALGPAFQQAKLTEGAELLAEKWELLVGNGADIKAVIEGMKKPANDFLHDALRWGLEIPASMKPMLEAMFRAGELTDENGDKLEDMSRLKFGEVLEDKFQLLIDKLNEFIDRLGDAAFDLNHMPSPSITFPSPPDYSGGGPGPGGTDPHAGEAGHWEYGIWYPDAERMIESGLGRLSRSGIGQPAIVQAAIGDGAGLSGGTMTIVTKIDARGSFFPNERAIEDLAEMVVRKLPDAATLYVSR